MKICEYTTFEQESKNKESNHIIENKNLQQFLAALLTLQLKVTIKQNVLKHFWKTTKDH